MALLPDDLLTRKAADMEPVPDDVVDDFRRMLALEPSEPIPAKLCEAYQQYRYMKDVCSAGRVSASELILLVMLTGSQRARKVEPEPTADAKAAPQATPEKPRMGPKK